MNLSDIKQIGIVGGGTSALMLCIEAAKLGITTSLLDPKVNCIGSTLATEHIIAPITNENIQKISLRCDAVIFNTRLEFEMATKLHSKVYPDKETMQELGNYKNYLELLEYLDIPTPNAYLQDNKLSDIASMPEISLPFKFIKQYQSHFTVLRVASKQDLLEFAQEVDEEAESFIIEPINEYSKNISFLCLVDEAGKSVQYDPIQELYEAEQVCKLEIATDLSKTMLDKLRRYNRKLLKELKGKGAFTIRYGIKTNKSVELIEVTPEISLGGLLTLEAYDTSIYEQYLHLVLGMKIVAPTLEALVHGSVKAIQSEISKEDTGHFYNLGMNNLCISRDRKHME